MFDPDLVPRLCGIGLAFWVASFFLDPLFIWICAAVVALSEAVQLYCNQRFEEKWRSPLGVLYILALLIGGAVFVLPFALIWRQGEAVHMMLSLSTIFGGLLHTTLVRGGELVRTICVGIPQYAGFASIPITLTFTGDLEELIVAYSAFIALTVYFIHVYLLNLHARTALIDAKQAAEAANAAKSEFLAIMSHEIRTPLNGVLGMAQVLQMSNISEETRRHVNIIESSGRNLERIVGGLLDVSRIEAGRLELSPAPGDLVDECRMAVELYRVQAEEKGLILTFAPVDAPPQDIIFDKDRYRQCVSNLISNAIKYSFEGEVFVTLSWRDGVAETMVRDQGVGIPEAERPHVFDPYRRAHNKTLHAVSGAGLGLAVVKQLAQLMGGDVMVESEVGEGSTFLLTVEAPLATREPV